MRRPTQEGKTRVSHAFGVRYYQRTDWLGTIKAAVSVRGA